MTIEKILFIASAIIKNEKDEILLLQRSIAGSFSNYWQLPEGKLEEGEKPQEALIRELKEEINVETESLDLQAVSATSLEAKGNKYLAFRIIFNVNIKQPEIELSQEHTDFKWFKREDIKNLDLLPGTLEAVELAK